MNTSRHHELRRLREAIERHTLTDFMKQNFTYDMQESVKEKRRLLVKQLHDLQKAIKRNANPHA